MLAPTVAPSRRGPALAVLCTGALMTILDGSIVVVALPALQRELGLSPAEVAWVVNAYAIAFGGLLLFAGRLGDLVGKRRVFLAGLGVFTSASAVCGLSTVPRVLIAARFLQGIGAASMTAVILAMVVTLYPEPRERARAIGIYSFVQAVGGTIGLLGGGLVVEVASPRAVFFLDVPVGVVALALAPRVLEHDPAALRGPNEPRIGALSRADVPGVLLVTASTMLAVYAILGSNEASLARTVGLGALAVVLLIAFFLRQATATHPLVALEIVRSRAVAGGSAVFGLLVAAMLGFQFLGALHLQRVLGYGASKTGFAIAPVAIAVAVFSLGFAARLGARFGSRRVLAAGLASIALGLLLLSRTGPGALYILDVLPSTLLLGAGAGLGIPSVMTIVMSSITERDAGLASGVLNTTQQVGGALGIAGLAALATSRTARLLAVGASPVAALGGGYRLAFAAGACLTILAIVITAALLRSNAKEAS